jgi:hypothetical protein
MFRRLLVGDEEMDSLMPCDSFERSAATGCASIVRYATAAAWLGR